MISTATDKIEAISSYPHLPFQANFGPAHIRSVPGAIPQMQHAAVPISESAKIFFQNQPNQFTYNGQVNHIKPPGTPVPAQNMLPKPAETMISHMDSSTSSMSGSEKQLSSPGNPFSSNSSLDEERKMKDKCSYLKALLQDKKQLQCFPAMFTHVERILDEAELDCQMNSTIETASSSAMNMVPVNGFGTPMSQALHRVTTAMAPSIQTLNAANNQLNLQTTTARLNGLNANNIIGSTQTLMQSIPSDSDNKTKERCKYLQQLLNDRKHCQSYPSIFQHVERLLDEEIVKVRSVLFQNGDSSPLELPSPQGPTVVLTEKVYVPVKDHPEYNFVGRILGPRGLTAKQLEQEAKCKIMVRGKGSMRDKKKEEMNRGKPNWEHLNDELHVLITVEDTENRAKLKMKRAVDEVNKLLIPAEGEDDLKKKQLMELAIINGTYRDFTAQPRLQPAQHVLSIPGLRSATTQGLPTTHGLATPIITRLPNGQTVISNGSAPPPPPLIAPPEGAFYYTTPLEYPYAGLMAGQGTSLLEYSFPDPTLIGKAIHI